MMFVIRLKRGAVLIFHGGPSFQGHAHAMAAHFFVFRGEDAQPTGTGSHRLFSLVYGRHMLVDLPCASPDSSAVGALLVPFVEEGSGGYLGHSVAISSDGNHVVLGGRYNDGAGHNAGQPRVFQYGGTNWSQLGEDLDGETAEDQFAYAVDLSSASGLDTGLAAGVVLIGCRARVGSVDGMDPNRRHFCRRGMD